MTHQGAACDAASVHFGPTTTMTDIIMFKSFQFTSTFQPRSAIKASTGLLFSFCDLKPWPMTFEIDPDIVDVNQQAKYLGQRSFISTDIVQILKTH